MTGEPTIDKIEVVDLRASAGPGIDGLFIAVHGQGRTGWYGPVADEPARYVDTMIADAVAGESFTDHRILHNALRRAIGPHANKAASWAIGAVDCAAWDLHGKLTGTPVAILLNASSAPTVPLYASWLRLDLSNPAATDAVAEVSQGGWSFTKWGLRRERPDDPHAEATRLAFAARRAVAAVGDRVAFDAVFTWDTRLMTAFAGQFDLATLLWLEDPFAPHDLGAHQKLAAIPLAAGERLLAGDDVAALLALGLRAFTLDVVGCGGLTRAVDLAAQARAAGIAVFPHGRSLIPAVHLAAAFPQTVAAAEYQLQWEPIRQLHYAEPWIPIRGQIILPTTPGLGVSPRSL